MAVNSYPVSRLIFRIIRDTFDAEAKLISEVDGDKIIYQSPNDNSGFKITIERLPEEE